MPEVEGPRILFVDDDPNILEGFRRTYRSHLNMEMASSGMEALLKLREQGPFAVVVSDQRMPQMSGIQLLREIRTAFPDTMRIMLTGNADQQTAIEAVNSGQIFRFLTKPCPPAALLNAVQDALRQWTGRQVERELLEGTLAGSVAILTEVLGVVHPESFGQQQRILRMVRHVAASLKLPDAWQYESAAQLSQVGCVALDANLLAKVNAGYALDGDEETLFREHPRVGARLIRQLPRLEVVADMIERQEAEEEGVVTRALAELAPAEIGGHLLRLARKVDLGMRRGLSYRAAVDHLPARECRQDMLNALRGLQLESAVLDSLPVKLKQLRVGQTLADEVFSSTGVKLASSGQVVTEMVLERLRAFAQNVGLREPILIQVPALEEAPGAGEA